MSRFFVALLILIGGCSSGGGGHGGFPFGGDDGGGGASDLAAPPVDLALADRAGVADLASMYLAPARADLAPPPPGCNDGTRNGNESDVDCGRACPACGNGKRCNGNGDC